MRRYPLGKFLLRKRNQESFRNFVRRRGRKNINDGSRGSKEERR
jgi:hypothetical protein